MQRLSPAFPCICGSEDWSYDANQVRWICNTCVRTGRPIPARPDYEMTDFRDWYRNSQYEYSNMREVVELLEDNKPILPRETLIHAARLRKHKNELARLEDVADIATLLNEMIAYSKTGEIYIRIPDQDIEMRFEW